MILGLGTTLSIASTAVTVASSAYGALCLWLGVRFKSAQGSPSSEKTTFPPVSILKPLKGTDPQMYDSLRSHCLQDYPEYEILFGVTDPGDPAAHLVKRLMEEFPARQIRLVECQRRLGANGKVSSLAQLAVLARHPSLVVNDSDIRVEGSYLRQIMTELERPGVGLVTCLYRGIPARTLGSRLEALSIATDFVPGVLVARQIEGGLSFALGSTLAMRRRDLEAIGGFEAILDYLADDYELGRRIRDRGLKVALSGTVVETFLPAYDFPEFVLHQVRWARTIRTSRPAGYAGLVVTFTLLWGAVSLLAVRDAGWSWALFLVALLVRISVAITMARLVLGDQATLRELPLVPVRDMLAVFFWAAGLLGRRITWRGETFRLEKGRLFQLSRSR